MSRYTIEQIRAEHESKSNGERQYVWVLHEHRAVLLAKIDKLRAEFERARADAWDEGYGEHRERMIKAARHIPRNPYR